MRWENDRELVTSLARRAVSDAAPGELALFEDTCAAYFESPRRARRTPGQRDPLGFGVETVVSVVSSIALTVSIEVLKHLAEHYAEKGTRKARGLFRRWRGKAEDAPPLPPLPPEVLAELRTLARTRGAAQGLSEEQADVVADSLVAELASRAPAED